MRRSDNEVQCMIMYTTRDRNMSYALFSKSCTLCSPKIVRSVLHKLYALFSRSSMLGSLKVVRSVL